MDVGAVAVTVEDHDDLGRIVDGADGVGRHGGELGGFARIHHDLPVAEGQLDAAGEDEEPVVAGVHPRLGRRGPGLEAHLDGDGRAGRAAERPGRGAAPAGGDGPDDDVFVVPVDVEQHVEVDLHGAGEGEQDIEADGPLARLDAADDRRAEVAAFGQLAEGPTERSAQRAEPFSGRPFDVVGFGHRPGIVRSCGFRNIACDLGQPT